MLHNSRHTFHHAYKTDRDYRQDDKRATQKARKQARRREQRAWRSEVWN